VNKARNKKVFRRQGHISKLFFHDINLFLWQQSFPLECPYVFINASFKHLSFFVHYLALSEQFVSSEFFHQISYNHVGTGGARISKLVDKFAFHIKCPFPFTEFILWLFNFYSSVRVRFKLFDVFFMNPMTFAIVAKINVYFLNADLIWFGLKVVVGLWGSTIHQL
jgi:hypothetical protein